MRTETPAPTVTLAALLADGYAGQAVADRARFELAITWDPAARRRLFGLASSHGGVPTHRVRVQVLAGPTCEREIGA